MAKPGVSDNGASLDLLLDFAELAARAAGGELDALDQFLVAAGLEQILDDYLHRDAYALSRIATHSGAVFGTGLGSAMGVAARGARAAELRVRKLTPGQQAAIRWGDELAPIVLRLADRVVSPSDAADEELQRLTASIEHLPYELRRSIVRLPQCFRSFDMRPADCGKLVDGFADRWPDRERPILVVGLRSAGSWLGPLHAALLLRAGYERVETMTIRPGQDWLAHEHAALERAAAANELVMLVDEPPRTGRQLSLAARELEGLGFGLDSIVVLVPLFEAEGIPPHLADLQHVVLHWPEWSVHEQLEPHAVLETLTALLPGRVAGVERIDGADQARHQRGHVSAAFRVVLESESGAKEELPVRAEGVGLGYLGRQALAVTERLRDFVPEVYGVDHGLLYRAWLPDEWRAQQLDASRVASYVGTRAAALAVPEDMSMRLNGREAVWEVVASILGDAFGGAKPLVRPLVRDASRRLLESAQPSIVDGSMAPRQWFAPPAPPRLLKVGYAERAFSNKEMYCYDPVYDVACAAATANADGFAGDLRAAYERQTHGPVPDARWLLYRLAYHEQIDRRSLRKALARQSEPLTEELVRACIEIDHTLSRACQEYFHRRFFSDVQVPGSGPLCAIDVDWVLETRWRSFPSSSPTGALAVRALAQHGYRAILATGRSLDEVRERCRAYRLAGGVAEYGALVYDHVDDRVTSLLEADEIALLDELRGALTRLPGVHVSPFHAGSIRAHRIASNTRLLGLDAEQIETALAASGAADLVRIVAAGSQTDFVPARIDKALGVRELAAELGEEPSERPLALAVGDALEDLPMLALAELSVVPANAEHALSARLEEVSGRQSRQLCQAGLLDAVGQLLGHDPLGCSVCRSQLPVDPDEELLQTILGALDGGRRRKLRQATRLATQVRRTTVRAGHDGRNHSGAGRGVIA